MIKCAIHQPHYFPWLGYLNKMASVDKFIILDEAQIEKGSNMYRNRLCTWDGKEKYITLAFKKKGCLNLKFNEIKLEQSIDWKERQKSFIINNYRKAPFFEEIWEYVLNIFGKNYFYINEVVEESIRIEEALLGISTEIVMQSTMKYDRNLKRNELLIALCKEVSADLYLSGNGAKKYMDLEMFRNNGIDVAFQKFVYPKYEQGHAFISNLSALDLLFHYGIAGAREIFWKNVNADYCAGMRMG